MITIYILLNRNLIISFINSIAVIFIYINYISNYINDDSFLITILIPLLTNQINSIPLFTFLTLNYTCNFNKILTISNIIYIPLFFILYTYLQIQLLQLITLLFFLLSFGNFISLTVLSYKFRILKYPVLNLFIFYILYYPVELLIDKHVNLILLLSIIAYLTSFYLTSIKVIRNRFEIWQNYDRT